MRARLVVAVCAVALGGGACQYKLPPRTPVFRDLGFSVSPTGCAGNIANVGNGCFMRDLVAVAQSGAHWARIDDLWAGVQRNPPGPNDHPQTDCVTAQQTSDCWYWSSIDQRVLGAEARGLKVLLVPTYAPTWAALPNCKITRCGPDPSHVDDFTNFIRESVKRYAPGGVIGAHVTSWEIWNEPNGPGFAPKADPVEYTQMLRSAYTVIKSVPSEKNADVLTGGTAPATNDQRADTSFKPLTWLRCLYDNSVCKATAHSSAKGFFTAVGHHPYSGIAAPLADFSWNSFKQTKALHQLMVENGDGAMKIWATEFGYSSDNNKAYGVGIKGQADFLVQAVIDWHAWPYAGPMFVYNLRNSYNPAETDPSQPDAERDKFSTAGLLNYDYSAKTAAFAFYALTHAGWIRQDAFAHV